MAVLVGLGVFLVPSSSHATFLLWEDGVNHNEIDWKYTETEHFMIYWYPEVEYTARQLVMIAEDIYEHDAKMWNYDLQDKIVVVILDTEDYANGFAAHNFNWITVWASHLYAQTRGRVDWLADVFSQPVQDDLLTLSFRLTNAGSPPPITVTGGMLVDVSGQVWQLPEAELDRTPAPRIVLHQNHPNPFNASTQIPYELSEPADVHLAVYNLMGQRVSLLVSRRQPAGPYVLTWRGTDDVGLPVSSGIYLYRLVSGSRVHCARMVLLK